MAGSIDVVVVGDNTNALGVLRVLGQHGLRLALVSREAGGIARHSRFASQHLLASGPEFRPEWLLERLALRPCEAVLLLTEELDVMHCLQDPAAWSTAFHTGFYSPDVARRLLDKTAFDALARQAGAPLPRTVIIDPKADLAQLDALRLPVIVKPARRDPAYSLRFAKAYKVEERSRLNQLIAEIHQLAIPLIVQEWIEGGDADIYFNLLFINEAGALCSSFVGQKTLTWPPGVGGTAACVAAPQFHHELTEISCAFLDKISCRGLIGIEYKRDTRDGRFLMVEPTVYRTDYQHEIAALSGCDFLPASVAQCAGQDQKTSSEYLRQCYWADYPATRYSARKQPGLEPAHRGLKRVDAYFRWNDPRPGIWHYTSYISNRTLGRLRRMTARR